jgi:hypothetical protein
MKPESAGLRKSGKRDRTPTLALARGRSRSYRLTPFALDTGTIDSPNQERQVVIPLLGTPGFDAGLSPEVAGDDSFDEGTTGHPSLLAASEPPRQVVAALVTTPGLAPPGCLKER